MRLRERKRKQTPEHGVHHHELPEKLVPLTPRYHRHRPNQFFSQPLKKNTSKIKPIRHVSQQQSLSWKKQNKLIGHTR